jgi:hypothetical protein
MQYVRAIVRLVPFVACAALVAAGGCALPFAYHDGLPAWTPPPGATEASIGYQRVFVMQERGSAWYVTPGARVGLAEPPLVADAGLTGMVVESEGEFGAALGPFVGIGYQFGSVGVILRPGAYMLAMAGGNWYYSIDEPLWQVSLLAGNGFASGNTHVSGGFRVSRLAVGPVLLADQNAGAVNLRLELSYMFPRTSDITGRVLTVGIAVGGPMRQDEYDPGPEQN